MGKNPFEEMDPDVQAMRASMRPSAGAMRWGRVLTGVLVVGCVTFGFAYYLPLRRAHETLSARFAETQSQISAANRAAEEARSKAKELGESKQALEKQLAASKQLEETRGEASRVFKSTLESKLQKQVASGQAALGSTGVKAVASLSLAHLLTRGKLEISPAGKATLCSVAVAANKGPLSVLAVAEKKDIPATLIAKLKTPLQYNLAVAELVTQTLLDKCAVDASKLNAGAAASAPPAAPGFEGKKLAGARVELWLEGAR